MSDPTNSTRRANGRSGHRPPQPEQKYVEDHSLNGLGTASAKLAKNRES
jgi:hypothetical protein